MKTIAKRPSWTGLRRPAGHAVRLVPFLLAMAFRAGVPVAYAADGAPETGAGVWNPARQVADTNGAPGKPETSVWSYLYKLDDGPEADDAAHDGEYTRLTVYQQSEDNRHGWDVDLKGHPVKRWRIDPGQEREIRRHLAAAIVAGTPAGRGRPVVSLVSNSRDLDLLRILAWTSPVDGVVRIAGVLRKDDDKTHPGDVRWAFEKNSSATDAGTLRSGMIERDENAYVDFTVEVKRGDVIYLVAEHVNGTGRQATLQFQGQYERIDPQKTRRATGPLFDNVLTDLTDWRLEQDGAGAILERSPGGAIEVQYDEAAENGVLLEPRKPVLLPDDLTRLGIWCARLTGDARIAFLVCDAAGTVHEAVTRTSHPGEKTNAWLLGGDGRRRYAWSRWTKCESIWLRSPGEQRMRERFPGGQVEEALARRWPKPYELTGIVIQPLRPGQRWGGVYEKTTNRAIRNGRGRIWIAGLQAYTSDSFHADYYAFLRDRGRWARNETQCLLPDEILPWGGPRRYRGRARWQVRVTRGYQGPIVWRMDNEGVFKPEDLLGILRHRIELPRLPRGHYWILTRSWDAGGSLIAERRLRWIVAEGPDAGLSVEDADFRLNLAAPGVVLPTGTDEARLHVEIAPDYLRGLPPTSECRIRVIDWRERPVREKTAGLVGGRIFVMCPVSSGTDYFATAEIHDGTEVLDRAHLHFGVRSEPETYAAIPQGTKNLDELTQNQARVQAEYWEASPTPRPISRHYPWTTVADAQSFRQWAQESRDMGIEIASFLVDRAVVEGLPGVYRWDVVDERVDILHEFGMQVVFSYASGQAGRRVPAWDDAWVPTRDQFGDMLASESVPSLWCESMVRDQPSFWRRLATRYRGHPAVAGYRIRSRPLVSRMTPWFTRYDYSRPAQGAFARRHPEIAGDGGTVPRPLTLPNVQMVSLPPDLSLQWQAWTAFQSASIRENIRRRLEAIRSVDRRRLVMVDRKNMPWAMETLLPRLAEDGNVAVKNEASPSFRDVSLRSMGWQTGVPHLSELHRHMPTSRSIADATNFFSSLTADRILWLVRWSPERLRLPAHETAEPVLRDYLPRTQPNWTPLVRMPCPEPDVLVFGSRSDDLLGGRRRGYFDDITGMRAFTALYRQHHVPVHLATEYTPWVDPGRFKLVFAVGEVLAESAGEALSAYAEGGGKLVLVGEVGRYAPGHREERESLGRRLAGLSNVRHIAEPHRLEVDGVRDWAAPFGFDATEVDALLRWAEVKRRVRVETDARPGFEAQLRVSADGNRARLAVMRSWYGWYRGNIEDEAVLREKFGVGRGTARLRGLDAGAWKVRRTHRQPAEIGTLETENGELAIRLDPAVAGEVQLYELARQR